MKGVSALMARACLAPNCAHDAALSPGQALGRAGFLSCAQPLQRSAGPAQRAGTC